MKKLSTTGQVTIYESTREEDGYHALLCSPRTRRSFHGIKVHNETDSAEAFLNHLYDHRLKDNLEVDQEVIDNIIKRIKEGKRFRASTEF